MIRHFLYQLLEILKKFILKNEPRYSALVKQNFGSVTSPECTITARQYGEVVLPDAIPAEHLSRFFGRVFLSAGKGGYGACFCRHGTNFIEHYACRDTSLIGAAKLSRYRILIGGTGAVSRYKLFWSQKTVTIQ